MTEKQSLAYNLYMQTGLTQKKIAELTGVNRKTLYEWIRHGNWSRARTASAHAPGILLDQYYGQLVALNENIASRDEVFPTREDTVIMTRINSVIKTLLPDKKSLATTIEHFTDFSEIVKEKHPELGDLLSAFVREYITDVLVAPVPDTQHQISNTQLPAKQSQSPIPNSQLHTDGVQNGVSGSADKQPESATSKGYSDLQKNAAPQQTIQKWGAAATMPTLPTPRNRAERRAQERFLEKALKAHKKAA